MNIAIIGTGKVGSSLAFAFLFHNKIKTILLNDIIKKKAIGEAEDLTHAVAILHKKIKIKTATMKEIKKADKIFICVGRARTSGKQKMKILLKTNIPLIKRILRGLDRNKTYILTNPVHTMGCIFKTKTLGSVLDHVRYVTKGRNGGWIVDRKGYTNWGIAAEAYKVIK